MSYLSTAADLEKSGTLSASSNYLPNDQWGNVTDPTQIYNQMYRKLGCKRVLSTGGTTTYTSDAMLRPVDYTAEQLSLNYGDTGYGSYTDLPDTGRLAKGIYVAPADQKTNYTLWRSSS
jgi:hypothetical protein